MPSFPFSVVHRDGHARAGLLHTPRGVVRTPCFMPVGTKGTVKGVTPETLAGAGGQIVLANTYHLSLRPGSKLVRDLGGLHRFMGWDGPLLTDSGGFQVFSLLDTARITTEGVTFRSVYDGSAQHFTPERSIREQEILGADMIMCFDECAPAEAPREAVAGAVRRTSAWAARCRAAHAEVGGQGTDGPQMLLGIVQGGIYPDLRVESTHQLLELDFPGYAVGGLSVGEDRSAMLECTAVVTELLPEEQIRYFMGIGDPPGILEVIERGVDLFDCVLPTRTARMGTAFTSGGRINLRNAEHATSKDPLDEGCPCTACRSFSRGVLRHLVMQREILGILLLSEHNLTFLFSLVERARQAIVEGSFAAFKEGLKGAW
ncbi:MAG: tRNA guanosine(34) transglycosylase Tgt [Actinobacteria bacterium]|nr:tRNA guanosine(34) transglycosylase Tgt [Actinomycetota bacterium]